jgi:hypothetical protein
MSREEIRKLAGGNSTLAEEIEAALTFLSGRSLAVKVQVPTGGRPREVWKAAA